MNEELFFFTIGAIFIYGQTVSTKIWHIASLLAFHIFVYSLLVRNTSQDDYGPRIRIFRVSEVVVGVGSLLSEYFLVRRRYTTAVLIVVEKLFAIVMLFGYCLSLYSVFYWCKKQKREKIFVDTGIYRYIRHPFYLGLFVSVIGTAGYLSSYISAVFILIYVFTRGREKILDEEKFMCKHDSSYVEYQKRVPSGFFI